MIGLPFGFLMGFLSGLVGIGGGIFLWPALLLMRWANVKEASAAASFFILVNSLSGLAGQLQKGFGLYEGVAALAMFACAGGFIGSLLGSKRMTPIVLQRSFALILCAISIQLVMKVL